MTVKIKRNDIQQAQQVGSIVEKDLSFSQLDPGESETIIVSSDNIFQTVFARIDIRLEKDAADLELRFRIGSPTIMQFRTGSTQDRIGLNHFENAMDYLVNPTIFSEDELKLREFLYDKLTFGGEEDLRIDVDNESTEITTRQEIRIFGREV